MGGWLRPNLQFLQDDPYKIAHALSPSPGSQSWALCTGNIASQISGMPSLHVMPVMTVPQDPLSPRQCHLSSPAYHQPAWFAISSFYQASFAALVLDDEYQYLTVSTSAPSVSIQHSTMSGRVEYYFSINDSRDNSGLCTQNANHATFLIQFNAWCPGQNRSFYLNHLSRNSSKSFRLTILNCSSCLPFSPILK